MEDGSDMGMYEFGITSVKNKRDLLQKDDIVTFQLDEVGRAAEVELHLISKFSNTDDFKFPCRYKLFVRKTVLALIRSKDNLGFWTMKLRRAKSFSFTCRRFKEPMRYALEIL